MLGLDRLEVLELQLGNNINLKIDGIDRVGEAIKSMRNLKELSVLIGDNCYFGSDEAKKMFQGLGECENLEKFKLHVGKCNQLQEEGFCVISTGIGKLKKIKDFVLLIAD